MKLAIIFPGIGYHCDKPLLYYSRDIVCEEKYDNIVNLSYAYEGGNIRGNKEKMKEAFETMYAQAENALEKINFNEYEDILFISKSVGTIIASAYAYKHNIKCKHILYTPLEYTFDYPHYSGCAFIGTSDSWSNVENVVRLANRENMPIYTYDNLNHSLEGKDTLNNINTLNEIMKITRNYIRKI